MLLDLLWTGRMLGVEGQACAHEPGLRSQCLMWPLAAKLECRAYDQRAPGRNWAPFGPTWRERAPRPRRRPLWGHRRGSGRQDRAHVGLARAPGEVVRDRLTRRVDPEGDVAGRVADRRNVREIQQVASRGEQE